MAAGLNFRGVYDGATTYYLHDLVTYGSALYILEDIGQDASQTGEDPGGSSAASQNWKVMTPAPDANVLHASGDMVYRNNPITLHVLSLLNRLVTALLFRKNHLKATPLVHLRMRKMVIMVTPLILLAVFLLKRIPKLLLHNVMVTVIQAVVTLLLVPIVMV